MIAAVVGPFSTFDTMPIEVRFVYWGGIIASAVILREAIRRVVAQYPGHPARLQRRRDRQRADGADCSGLPLRSSMLCDGIRGSMSRPWITNILVVFLVCCGVVCSGPMCGPDVHGAGAGGKRSLRTTARLARVSAGHRPGDRRDPCAGSRRMTIISACTRPAGSARVLMRFRDALGGVVRICRACRSIARIGCGSTPSTEVRPTGGGMWPCCPLREGGPGQPELPRATSRWPVCCRTTRHRNGDGGDAQTG
jgi:hypothetical protein